MTIASLLTPDRVFPCLRVSDKQCLLQDLAHRTAPLAGIGASAILEALSKREQLGSTGVGQGVAIPHARLRAVKEPIGLFARLKAPIEFNAIDYRRVDLVFLLLLPAESRSEQLTALACIARRLRSEQAAANLREAACRKDIFEILIGATS